MKAETERIISLISIVQGLLWKTAITLKQGEIIEVDVLLSEARHLLEQDDAQGLNILMGPLHPRSGWSEQLVMSPHLEAPMKEIWRLVGEIQRWLARQPGTPTDDHS
jgi:hypothetical protein